MPTGGALGARKGAGVVAHVPVLLEEVIAGLAIRADGVYLDGTFGRGGHSRAILARLGPAGRLLALDRDPDAVRAAQQLVGEDGRFLIARRSFGGLRDFVAEQGLLGRIDGLLLDLGVSSPQLEDASRGFGFRADGPLDMRMDPDSGQSAAHWLASASEQELAEVFWRYGEERHARRIARAICEQRVEQPLLGTGELAALVSAAVPRSPPGRHPATRIFQAIRIFINAELDELAAALAGVRDVLAPGGRLCVISFHSLEDRIVKRYLRAASRVDPALAGLPVVPASAEPFLRLPARAIRPAAAEISRNPRSRSAVLRIGERCA